MIKKLVREREKIYKEIKKELTPTILKLIKREEKNRGGMGYWDLCGELESMIRGLTTNDYERIIEELEEKNLIKKEWSPSQGRFLKTLPTVKKL